MTQQRNELQVEILNDLIKINNDRIEGYLKAAELLKLHRDLLIPIFDRFQAESQKHIQELTQTVMGLGGVPDEGTTTGGKIYRAWMEVKAGFGADDPLGILNACEGGEDAAKAAYKSAIDSNSLFEVLPLVQAQETTILKAHNQIKTLRAQYKN
jgi:uncharacterized protein (TIGR02284 family)